MAISYITSRADGDVLVLCRSTDVKPTPTGAGWVCMETDTGARFAWIANAWVQDQGLSGAAGAQGPQGPEGPQGPQGPPGADGVGGVTLATVIDTLYPVGALYVSTLATNPATLLGRGTWAAFGAGRTLVGFNAADTDFDAAEETGGAKTRAISAHSGAAVADHANHTHTYTQVVDHVHTLATGTTATGNFAQVIGTVDTSSGGTGATPTQTALGTRSGNPVGSAGATGTTAGPSATLTHAVTQPAAHTDISVVQPYITVFFWKRTA